MVQRCEKKAFFLAIVFVFKYLCRLKCNHKTKLYMKKIATLLTMVTVVLMAAAQMANPVTFTSQLKTTNGSSEGEIVFRGRNCLYR